MKYFLFLLLLVSGGVYGQGVQHPLLRLLQQANKSEVVSYDYTVQLVDVENHKVVDSTVGKLYKNRKEFVDSSGSAWSALLRPYYYKLDHQRQEAAVYNIEVLKAKLKLTEADDPTPIMVLSDSLIARYGKLSIDTTQSKTYRVQVQMAGQVFERIDALISKKDYRLLSVLMETPVTEELGEKQKRVIRLQNISYQFNPALLSATRYFKTASGKPTPIGRYADYHITNLVP